MIETLFFGAMALPKENTIGCIMAICNQIKAVKTEILAKWMSLHTRFLGDVIQL